MILAGKSRQTLMPMTGLICFLPQVPKAADPAALPKIKLTDNLYDIRAAFEEVQRQVGRSSGFCGASLRALWRTPLMLWSCA